MKKPGFSSGRISSVLLWSLGILAALVLIVILVPNLIDDHLVRYGERKINEAVDGYEIRIGDIDIFPFGAAIVVNDLVLRQEAHPEPPLAVFPRIVTSVHWRELLSGHLVSDVIVEKPQLHINLRQLRAEAEDETPVQERGWQEAVKNVYPLKINRVEIVNGSLTYIDQDPDRPLELNRINLTAGNIRNIHSPEETYPSPFRVEADIFGKGHGLIEGNANFLAEPHPTMKARLQVKEIPLGQLLPVTTRANVHLTGGILAGDGRVEYSPRVREAILDNLTIDGLKVDYVHAATTAEEEKQRAQKAKKGLGEAKESEWRLKVNNMRLTRGALGFVNKAQTPSYRVSLDAIDLQVKNLSNRFRAGEAEVRLEGQFMHSGDTFVRAVFRPIKEGADLDMLVAITGTRMTDMNDLLRAHTGMDVVGGIFSYYSEIEVRGRQIDGYAKPLFRDVDVYDPRQEQEEGLIDKIKEGLTEALAQILENPQERAATRFDLSGTVESPEASTWQIVLELIRNGFFEAILPGFENWGENGQGKEE
ncbi:MAG: DUF748 domain-containing protein [Syntrophotaleaceae bacterium]